MAARGRRTQHPRRPYARAHPRFAQRSGYSAKPFSLRLLVARWPEPCAAPCSRRPVGDVSTAWPGPKRRRTTQHLRRPTHTHTHASHSEAATGRRRLRCVLPMARWPEPCAAPVAVALWATPGATWPAPDADARRNTCAGPRTRTPTLRTAKRLQGDASTTWPHSTHDTNPRRPTHTHPPTLRTAKRLHESLPQEHRRQRTAAAGRAFLVHGDLCRGRGDRLLAFRLQGLV